MGRRSSLSRLNKLITFVDDPIAAAASTAESAAAEAVAAASDAKVIAAAEAAGEQQHGNNTAMMVDLESKADSMRLNSALPSPACASGGHEVAPSPAALSTRSGGTDKSLLHFDYGDDESSPESDAKFSKLLIRGQERAEGCDSEGEEGADSDDGGSGVERSRCGDAVKARLTDRVTQLLSLASASAVGEHHNGSGADNDESACSNANDSDNFLSALAEMATKDIGTLIVQNADADISSN